MSFTFQTPFEGSGSLIDAVGYGSKGAISGGGIYAFASAKGVDLLFSQIDFSNFLESFGNSYHLIVGIDEITNTDSLEKLGELQNNYENLKINVFFHNERKLFHPKFTWFLKNDGEGEVIIGSGNLTESGISNNWEAFFSIVQSEKDFANTLKSWDEFLEEHSSFLLSIDDRRVVNAAQENNVKSSLRQGNNNGSSSERIESKPEPSSGASLKKTLSVVKKANDSNVDSPVDLESEQPLSIRFLAREAMTARETGDYSQILFSEEAYTNFFKINSGDYIYYDVYNKNGYLGQVVNPSITVKASSNYAIGIASRKEGKSKGRAEPEIKSNFMVNVEDIADTPPILLVAIINGSYKVVFSHPSNGLGSLHLKLKGYLKGRKEKTLTDIECEEIINDIPLISLMIN
ncbi:phospholipase D family protein [Vibrio tasmaniensis]|uniref:phospholipase D family protein n=1 Tax=Vibrio tasmaniensis TaxID=212663 RepID=UPI0014368A6A|nr:phospholipase D family protein [Vibrio tasmaniensis]